MDNGRINISCGNNLLVTLLTVLFVGLKLTDNIDWSWWWVLSPLWITAVFFVAWMLLSLWVNTKRRW
ncbi:MAG: hypothetical protein J6Y37_15685 [Paludibacteraceae bacterium]|nr:hypothetical protein [Paludibacteraceae bacterium]